MRPDPLDELRRKLQNNVTKLIEHPDAAFSPEELQVVDSRFDQLYEEIAKLRDQYKLTKEQLDDLKKQIDEFKTSARSYPKGLWAKVTSNKLVKATGKLVNTPEGRTFLFQWVRRALGVSDDA